MQIRIENQHGKILFTKEFKGSTRYSFSVEELPAGLYFLRIITEDLQETIKIVKQLRAAINTAVHSNQVSQNERSQSQSYDQ